MPLEHLRIINLTIFKDLSLDLASGVNVFIGQNGSGKTHLLKAVYGACEKRGNRFKDLFKKSSLDLNLSHDKNNKNIDIYIYSTDTDKIHPINKVDFLLTDDKGTVFPISNNIIKVYAPTIKQATFIPCKDMLTHSKGLLAFDKKYRGFPFDKTLTDIIATANILPLKEIPEIATHIIPKLTKIIDGEVDTQDDEFIIIKNDGRTVNFAVEAEGIKKIGLLWRLLMNESINEGSILLWDEPEANLNPEYLPVIVDCLLELSRHNVQVLVSTHNYIFAKYFDVKRQESDSVSYHALYITDGAAECETKSHFADLEHNSIGQAFDRLLDEVYNLGIGD